VELHHDKCRAEDLDLRDAPVKGEWMVIFCDPTLPETTAAP
jgi:hypothetical protein